MTSSLCAPRKAVLRKKEMPGGCTHALAWRKRFKVIIGRVRANLVRVCVVACARTYAIGVAVAPSQLFAVHEPVSKHKDESEYCMQPEGLCGREGCTGWTLCGPLARAEGEGGRSLVSANDDGVPD